MIKFREKNQTLYGGALLIPVVISFNLFLIQRFFKIKNRNQLLITNLIIFLMFQLEILLIVFLIGKIDLSNFQNIGIVLVASSLFFFLGWDNLPYWSEEQSEHNEQVS